MKTIANTQQLLNAIIISSNYTQKNGDDANKLVFEYKNSNTFIVKATDFIESIEFNINANDLNTFEPFSVNAKELITLLRIAKTDDISIEIIGDYFHIKSGKSKAKIQKFATIPLMQKDILVENSIILTKGFLDALKASEHAIDTNNPKQEITGALIQSKNGLIKVVSTDTKRLSIQSVGESENEFDMIIPKNAVKSLYKNFTEDTVINITNSEFFVENDNQRYSSKQINGLYIEYNRVIPQSYQQTLKINKKILEEVLKDSSALDGRVQVEIKEGKIKSSALDGSIETEKEIETSSANIKFAIESKYVLDYLSVCSEEAIQIGFNEENFPISFIRSPELFEIIMPINTNQK